MTVREFYEIAGSYETARANGQSDEELVRYLKLFPGDHNFSKLEFALAQGNDTEAYRAAHSLMGVSLNVGLTNLAEADKKVTEDLKNGDHTALKGDIQALRDWYKKTCENIAKL